MSDDDGDITGVHRTESARDMLAAWTERLEAMIVESPLSEQKPEPKSDPPPDG